MSIYTAWQRPYQAAVRTIPISPNTNYVNVEGGEIIRFVSGDQEFAWHFLVARTVRAFDLNEVAPPGIPGPYGTRLRFSPIRGI